MTNTAILTTELRIALYRRVAALAYRNYCTANHIPHDIELEELEVKIAYEVEVDHILEYGPQNGLEYACELLSDMVDPDFLNAPPRLTEWGVEAMNSILGGGSNMSNENKILH
ncbi:DUF5375 family protein [Sodalis sp. RH21]|uniref:DUF5375 family protein n=1 Tax=unclassified Sodalis (in: enterobacteria) TaxID=2636512 RepID=UPI0039B6C848